MRFKQLFLAAAVLFVTAQSAAAQNNSLNSFSPFSFYGIGDIRQPGTTAQRSMGGVGLAYRNPFVLNTQNPAAYSAMLRQTFIFSINGEGRSSYLQAQGKKTSHNGFNLQSVDVAFPLFNKVGMGISVSPFSSVGYQTSFVETDPELADTKQILYTYWGEGDVALMKAGIGAEVFNGLSLGANLLYYHGNIDRYSNVVITPLLTTATTRSVTSVEDEFLSTVNFMAGLQYDMELTETNYLTLGATYEPAVNMSVRNRLQTTTAGILYDTIDNTTLRYDIKMPARYGAGIYYMTPKWNIGLDYDRQDWKDAMDGSVEDGIRFSANNNYKFGVQFIPDPMDMRNALKRWTYRLGVRYGDFYVVRNGNRFDDKAVSIGVGIPLRYNSASSLNLGFEVGQRGSTSGGMVEETYFNVSVGVNMFGEGWFAKFRYK